MRTRTPSAQLLIRRSALLLASALLWMSGGACLRHTDDLSAYLAFQAHGSRITHAFAAPPQVVCAACEWEQSAAAAAPPAVPIIRSPLSFIRYAAATPVALHRHAFDYTALRGPPSA